MTKDAKQKARILVKDFYASQSWIVPTGLRLSNAKEYAIYCLNEMQYMVEWDSSAHVWLVEVSKEVRKIESIKQLSTPNK